MARGSGKRLTIQRMKLPPKRLEKPELEKLTKKEMKNLANTNQKLNSRVVVDVSSQEEEGTDLGLVQQEGVEDARGVE